MVRPRLAMRQKFREMHGPAVPHDGPRVQRRDDARAESRCSGVATMKRVCLLAGLALLAGCAHLGPKTVAVDRFDYSTSIADSWKQQTLLNIVKLRYLDLPVFVDVSSIVAGYSLQTGVNIAGVASSRGAVQGDYGSLGGQAVYTDRPTITYVPMTGEKFLRGLIGPIDPKSIFFMLQAGYPADFVLALTVESLNGLANRSMTGGRLREADPGFRRALQLLRDLQADGAIGMRVEEDKQKGQTAVVLLRREDLTPESTAMAAELRGLLRLSPDTHRFGLQYSPMRGATGELTVNSRSMLQILQAISSYVDVPEQDVQQRRATASSPSPERPDVGRIRSGPSKPDDAFVAVQYGAHWFWIDNTDLLTKRAMTAVMFMFTLADTGSAERLPLVTIPAQ
jgi:hypothetical protein